MSKGLDPEVANYVWDLLVAEADAFERDRWAFVDYITSDNQYSSWEYRFIGTLGFGGKLLYSPFSGAWVSCYPSDCNDARSALIDRLNERLVEIAPGGHVRSF